MTTKLETIAKKLSLKYRESPVVSDDTVLTAEDAANEVNFPYQGRPNASGPKKNYGFVSQFRRDVIKGAELVEQEDLAKYKAALLKRLGIWIKEVKENMEYVIRDHV